MLRTKYLLFMVITTFLFNGYLNAQCSPNLTSAGGGRGYQDRGDRCEGFYRSDVSSSGLNIVGITQGKFRFNFDKKDTLLISVPVKTNKPIKVRAGCFLLEKYYRMDAQISANGSFHWPIGDVLFNAGLTYKMVGIAGWIGDGKDKVYVPVKATSKMLGSPESNDVYIYLHAAVPVENVRWRFANVDQDGYRAKASGWHNSNKGAYESGKRIACKVPPTMKGKLFFEIRADPQRGGEALKGRYNIALR